MHIFHLFWILNISSSSSDFIRNPSSTLAHPPGSLPPLERISFAPASHPPAAPSSSSVWRTLSWRNFHCHGQGCIDSARKQNACDLEPGHWQAKLFLLFHTERKKIAPPFFPPSIEFVSSIIFTPPRLFLTLLPLLKISGRIVSISRCEKFSDCWN